MRPVLLLDPGDGFRGIDGAPGRRALQQVQELRGDAHLGAVQRRQQQAGLAVDGLGDEAFLLDFQGDRLHDGRLGDLQQRRGGLDELGLDDGAVALVGKGLQHMPHAGLGADHGITGNAQALRQGVRGLEADAVDVQGQAVGIFLHPGDGLGAVGLVDAHGPGRAHAMAVQKDHDVANHLLLGPGRDHAGGALGADAVEFLQAVGGLRDDVEHLGAEGLHQFAGKVRANAFDHARTEVALDALQRGWGHDTQLRGLELQAMRAVGHPAARALDIFPWGDGRGGAHDGDQIAVAAHLDAEDTEARLLTVKGDALHAAREVFERRLRGRSRGHVRHHGLLDTSGAAYRHRTP